MMSADLLAVRGGDPVVPAELQRFSHPKIDDGLVGAVVDQLHRAISIYDNGGVYAELESAWSCLVDREFVLSLNSGTSALLSAYFGLNLDRGSEVIVPCYNFFAAATPLFTLGLVPVLADCGVDGNILPASLSSLIGPDTGAISVTHLWGNPCDMTAIMKIADIAGVPVVEDASHAHGATFQGRAMGSFGAVAAWSLQGKKIVSAGEGGLLATSQREVFERAVLLGHFNRRAALEVLDPAVAPYAPTGLGNNLRMHPLAAALAFSQLPDLDDQLRHRREVAQIFHTGLSDIEGISVPELQDGSSPSYYSFAFRFDPELFPGVSKEQFVQAVVAEGAVDVDIPGATRPLSDYRIFDGTCSPIAGALPARVPPIEELAGSWGYWKSVIKMPTFYGSDRVARSDAYVRAIQKVARNRRLLSS